MKNWWKTFLLGILVGIIAIFVTAMAQMNALFNPY